MERLEFAPAQKPVFIEKSKRNSVPLFKQGFAVLLIIQGLLDQQNKDRQIVKTDSPIFLPSGLGDHHFYVGKNGEDSKSSEAEDQSPENFLRFRLGGYFYAYRRSGDGKDLSNHWLIRRSVRVPQREMNLWVSIAENSENGVVKKAEYYSYSKEGKVIIKYISRGKAIALGKEMICKIEQDLASGESPKRA